MSKSQEPAKRRPWRRVLLFGGLTLVAGAALAGLAAFGLLRSDPGRHWLAARIESTLSVPGQFEISIERLDGRLPQEVRLTGLRLGDAEGAWLSVDSLALDWSPLELLGGTLRVASLRVEDLVLDRLPETSGDDDPASPAGLPDLPFDIAVERLSVADLVLGEAILGQRGRFRVEGRAAAKEAEGLATALSVERSDGGAGRLKFDALYRPQDDHLRLDATIEEPADGLIARLGGLPGLPAIQGRLNGDGSLSAWRGRLSLNLERLVNLQAQIALSRDRAFNFDIAGQARLQDPARFLPPEVPEALVAGELGFAIAGALRDGGELEIAQARVENPAARLTLAGKVALDTLTLDTELEAEVLDPALAEPLAPGLRARGLGLTVRARGPVLQPHLEARLRAGALSAPGLSAGALEAKLDFAPERPLDRGPPEGMLKAEGSLAGLALEGQDALAPLIGERVTWRLAGRLGREAARFDAETLSVEAGPARLDASGALDLRDGNLEAAASLTLADLAGLSPLLGLDASGGAEFEAWIESPDLGTSATAILTGTLRDLTLAAPALDALLGGTSDLAANLSLAPDGHLSVRDIAFDTDAARLKGNLAATPGLARIEADYDLSLPELGVLAQPLGLDLAGGASLRGRAEGDPANPRLSGKLGLAKARIEGIEIERAEVTFGAEDPAGRAHGRVEITALGPLGEVQAAADYLLAAPNLRLTGLSARSRGAAIRGDLVIPTDGGPITGALRGQVPELAPWLALAGLDGGGAATADLQLTAEGRRQGAALNAEVTQPLLRLEPARAVRGRTARIELSASDLTGTPTGRARLRAADLEIDDLSLEQLALEAEGGLAGFDWRLSGAGDWRGPLNLAAEGRLEMSGDSLNLELAKLSGRALERDLALQAPTRLTRRAGALSLAPLELRFGAAAVTARAELDDTQLAGKLAVEALPLASLAAVLPSTELNGVLSANLEVSGPRANPTGGGQIRLSGIDLESMTEGPILELALATAWREGRLSLTGAVSGLPGPDVALAAEVPLRLDPRALTPVVAPDQAISGRVEWRGAMAALWPWVPLDGHRLSGDTEVTLRVDGTVAEPQFNGAVALTGGRYENLDTGTRLRDLDARIEFDRGRARIAHLTAGDGAAGTLSAAGELALDPAADFPFELSARLRDFVVVRRDEVTATTDADIAVEGTLNDMLVAGRLETKLVEVRIVDTLPPEVVVLNVTEIDSGAKAEVFQAQDAADDSGTVALDIAVVMPRRVFVRGRGLDSEWSGELRVGGTAAEPKIVGEVELVRGQLSLLTKTFRLTGGKVSFPAGADSVPELDVTAEHDTGEVVAIAKVTGPATNPEITLGSNPELPRDEIVSSVLFGKKRGQLSALEAAELAAAVAQLTGTGGGVGILDSARGLIGADVLRIGGAAEGGAGGPSIEAGKYAADGVYVGVKKGVADQSGAVAVEIEVTPNISVESETGATGDSDIGVKFKWDY